MIRSLATFAAAVAFVAPLSANAQTPGWTAETVAAASKTADDVIAQADAAAFFVNITDTDIPAVRHTPSGMVCTFNIDDLGNNIRFYPVAEGGPPHGDDVSCASWWDNVLVTTYATRYPAQYDAETLYEWAIQDIYDGWTDVEMIEDEFRVAKMPGQEAPMMDAFNASYQGHPLTTLVVLQNIGEWSFKGRASGPQGDTNVMLNGSFGFAMAIPGGWDVYRAELETAD